MAEQNTETKLGFLDSLARLFRREPEPMAAEGPGKQGEPGGFETLRASFEAALRNLNEKAAACRREAESRSAAQLHAQRAEDREAERVARIESTRRKIRDDIEKGTPNVGDRSRSR